MPRPRTQASETDFRDLGLAAAAFQRKQVKLDLGEFRQRNPVRASQDRQEPVGLLASPGKPLDGLGGGYAPVDHRLPRGPGGGKLGCQAIKEVGMIDHQVVTWTL
jgi:hypothetical protein